MRQRVCGAENTEVNGMMASVVGFKVTASITFPLSIWRWSTSRKNEAFLLKRTADASPQIRQIKRRFVLRVRDCAS